MGFTSAFDGSRLYRILVTTVVVLWAVGGAGAVVAAESHNQGRQCLDENPTRAFEHASEDGVQHSATGRMTALRSNGCVPDQETTSP